MEHNEFKARFLRSIAGDVESMFTRPHDRYSPPILGTSFYDEYDWFEDATELLFAGWNAGEPDMMYLAARFFRLYTVSHCSFWDYFLLMDTPEDWDPASECRDMFLRAAEAGSLHARLWCAYGSAAGLHGFDADSAASEKMLAAAGLSTGMSSMAAPPSEKLLTAPGLSTGMSSMAAPPSEMSSAAISAPGTPPAASLSYGTGPSGSQFSETLEMKEFSFLAEEIRALTELYYATDLEEDIVSDQYGFNVVPDEELPNPGSVILAERADYLSDLMCGIGLPDWHYRTEPEYSRQYRRELEEWKKWCGRIRS